MTRSISTPKSPEEHLHRIALQDFRNARREAALQDVVARLKGKKSDLLSFEEVREKLKSGSKIRRGVRDIPLDAIIGSVGRHTDFTRKFLPRHDSDAERWAKVKMLMYHEGGLPPIEVYQIGEAYFVLDGNHRVSVAKHMGEKTIPAHVTEIHTRVPITPDDKTDDVIIKAEYAEFLTHTLLDQTRPEAELQVTGPGHYQILQRQIAHYHQVWAQETGQEQPYADSAARWHDEIYLPVAKIIEQRGIVRDFPERTITDLYAWVTKRRAELQQALGRKIDLLVTIEDLTLKTSPRPARVAARVGGRIKHALVPPPLEDGPSPGKWRQKTLQTHSPQHLFKDFLVPISGEPAGWDALTQAILLAKPENDRIHGLHVVPTPEEKESARALAIKARFEQACEADGIDGDFVIDAGITTRRICEHAHWSDMVVLKITHPPGPSPAARLASGLRTLIRQCSRPIWAVTGISPKLRRILLAYDDSRKSREALFIATYLSGKWELTLDVVSINEAGRPAVETLKHVATYTRKRGLLANMLPKEGPIAKVILETAKERDSDLIVMGGYGFNPMLEVVLGSAVDKVLRKADIPVLFCR